jgi:hypothetical protein
MQFVCTRGVECEKFARQPGVEGTVGMSEYGQRPRPPPLQIDEYSIDAVERGSGHEADIQLGHERGMLTAIGEAQLERVDIVDPINVWRAEPITRH